MIPGNHNGNNGHNGKPAGSCVMVIFGASGDLTKRKLIPVMNIGQVNMEFDYARDFGRSHRTGYERLLYDCIAGDATLFQRADMVETGWNVIQPVLDVCKALPNRKYPNYAAGSWGPAEADDLLRRDGREWRQIE
jgi:glucose-6-phosphate 1-dehydrogenase